jgi:hypothetical protein
MCSDYGLATLSKALQSKKDLQEHVDEGTKLV